MTEKTNIVICNGTLSFDNKENIYNDPEQKIRKYVALVIAYKEYLLIVYILK